jgi:hypothetical protein
MSKKKIELPKIVSITDELLEQVKYFVGSMPLASAQKIIKEIKSWPTKEEGRSNVELNDLNGLAGYLRILPLYMVGELYTQIQMDIKDYKVEDDKEVEDKEPKVIKLKKD